MAACPAHGTKLFLWQAERGSRRTRRHPRDDPRAEVGEDVRDGVCVGVRVGAVECQLNNVRSPFDSILDAVLTVSPNRQ